MNKAQQGIARSFARAVSSYDRYALVQNQIAQHLVAYLPQGKKYNHIREFGCGTGLLTKALTARIEVQHWLLNDLNATILEKAEQYLEHQTYTKLIGDISEVLSRITTPLDLITSASALQWIEDPFLLLSQAQKHLTPQGALLISTFGERNLHELRTLTGRGLRYFPASEYREFCAEYFSDVKVEEEEVVLQFPSLTDLLHHLRATGVTHLPNDNISYLCGRTQLAQLEKEYTMKYPHPQGGISLTYHPIYIRCSKRGSK